MHAAQSIVTETEIRHLAATPYQIINPGSNKPIIGIFQDSLLGSFRFTRKDIKFSPRDAMNLLMSYPHVDVDAIRKAGKEVTNFDILSQITPPITLKYKTGLFDEDTDDAKDPENNNVLEIYAGKYIRGQVEKSVFEAATKGILHRICNDFGNMACADYNDNLQNIVTEYMKTSSFSVGISDLIADRATNEKIVEAIRLQKMEVQTIIDKVHLGIFENNTAASNMKHFELMLSNILNKATEESGKIGKKSLSKDNRFLMIVNSGSKGNLVNISQMISCLGQQAVDGKRIAYGFDDRTLPHYKKYDDSPNSRGFVENSYITGLTAPELFFHAMAGRTGLIDTAVKSVTSDTPIVIIQNGVPVYTQIGSWIDNQLDDPILKDQVVYTPADRNLELLNIQEGQIYIPTTDQNGLVTWGDVTAITRHDPGERLYEIVTQSGRTVTVSESQSLLIWDASQRQILPKDCPSVVVGDSVPITLSLGMPPNVTSGTSYDTNQIANDISNGIFDVNLLSAPDTIINEIITILYNANIPQIVYSDQVVSTYFQPIMNITGTNYRKNPVVVSVQTIESVNGLSMLCSRVKLFVNINIQQCTVSFVDENMNIVKNTVLDPIVSINIIGVENNPKLYDLTIPSTLNFGLANGLQVRDTSSTGYIQRRLVKGLEDLMINYDMTVRNNKGKIIQFTYGDDNFDSMKVENQILPMANLSVEDIYMHFDIPGMVEAENNLRLSIFTKEAISRMNKQKEKCRDKCYEYATKLIRDRDLIVEKVFLRQSENSVRLPVAFQYLIQNIQGQLDLKSNSAVDITPFEAFELIEEYFERVNSIPFAKTNPLFRILYFYYLTPRDLLVKRRFHKKALILLLETVLLKFKEALVHPGEMVGVVAATSTGEPCTQLTLNSIIWSEKIILRKKNSPIEVRPIGEFIEEQILLSKKVEFMQAKDTTYAELSDENDYEIPCATEDGRTVWRKIEAVTQHPVVNEDGTNTMLKVTTKGRREVTATKAKSFLQLIDGKIQSVYGKDLKVGDYLPVSRKTLDFKEITQFSTRAFLSPKEYLYGTELQKASNLRHERHWWKNHADKSFVLPHSSSQSLSSLFSATPQKGKKPCKYLDILPGFVYMKSMGVCDYCIPETIDLTYEFGYLVGAYASEGSGTNNAVSICNNSDEYLKPIEDLCTAWKIPFSKKQRFDRGGEGWKSQELHIYNTILSRILIHLCGTKSYQKFVSPVIVFSNQACMRGFLDAYIGGDGSVSQYKRKDGSFHIIDIRMWSASHTMMTDVMVLLRNLGISSHIAHRPQRKPTGRTIIDRRDSYSLGVTNRQAQQLANLLHLTIPEKQERIELLKKRTDFKYEYSKEDLFLPNIIDGQVVMESRDNRMMDLEFDPIVSIEEVPNTTPYAYDLTVEDTRTFDIYNGMCMMDTFHGSGIASKSNVTRGVPRIEEILRLTKNPKNPSMTVYLKPMDETDQDKASQFATRMSHTKLIDIVKSVQVCFDPNPTATHIVEDQLFLEQFFEFEKMIEDCMESPSGNTPSRSKWIIRIEMDQESLIDKNINMDDIHFAISNSEYGKDVQCIFSDHNMDKLVFRIRTNGSVFDKSKKTRGVSNPLDQSDEIYLLKNFQDTILNHIVLRGVNGVNNILPRKIQNSVVKENDKYVKKDTWVLDTTGSNLMETLALDYIDSKRTISNDIKEVFHVLGIEAARQCIQNELIEVLAFSGASVNYHHTSLLCDRMTCNKNMVSIFRSGLLNDNVGPIAKATFEVHTEVFLNAARHAELDHMRGVSANIMCGQHGSYGTNASQIILDMKAFENIKSNKYQRKDVSEEIERGMAQVNDTPVTCSKIEIQNNIVNIRHTNENSTTCYDDGYNAGF